MDNRTRGGKIIALGNARLNSSRCLQKMVRPFANTTLAEIAIGRLGATTEFDGVYFAAYDEGLKQIVRQFPTVTLIERSEASANANEPITLVHDYLRNMEFDYVMWVNSCHCLLQPKTLDEAVRYFRAHPEIRSLTSVTRTHNWFYSMDGDPVNNKDPRIVNTKLTPNLWEVRHAFHLFSKEHFFRTASYWNNRPGDPYLYEIDGFEALDVDTELDFVISEQVYKAVMIDRTVQWDRLTAKPLDLVVTQ
jgi:CMP-N-acetylneuraminic acid synthetase